jgi:hypothetical protein
MPLGLLHCAPDIWALYYRYLELGIVRLMCCRIDARGQGDVDCTVLHAHAMHHMIMMDNLIIQRPPHSSHFRSFGRKTRLLVYLFCNLFSCKLF